MNVLVLQQTTSYSSLHKRPSPFIRSAYGVESTFTAENILARWRWIYDQSMMRGIRIADFSTDCDNRYLSSMRIPSGFFTANIAPPLRDHPDAYDVNLPTHWTWYYLNARQTFAFMQVRAATTFIEKPVVKNRSELLSFPM